MKSSEKSKLHIELIIAFVLYLGLSAYLVYIHEPWRDEIHAWLMAKNMSIPELVRFSRHEGHPVLWHILLMPFAKTGAPVWTMNALSSLIVALAAFFFLFRTKLHSVLKIVILFTIPFLYIFSAIARNYCLVLLGVVLVGVLYEKRYEKPILYSLPIMLLVFSHALAWGFVAGLTITFHVTELIKGIAGKSKLEKKSVRGIVIGFVGIALCSVFAVLTLAGERNSGYMTYRTPDTYRMVICLVAIAVLLLAYSLIFNRETIKESIVILTTNLFMVLIIFTVYSALILEREMLVNAFLLFWIITCWKKPAWKTLVSWGIAFVFPLIFLGSGLQYFNTLKVDRTWYYSGAQQMAAYINAFLPEEKEILVDSGVICQTIVPYTDKKLYDILYQAEIEDSLYHVFDIEGSEEAVKDIPNHSEYKGKYIICAFAFEEYDTERFEQIFETDMPIENEQYTLYYIH